MMTRLFKFIQIAKDEDRDIAEIKSNLFLSSTGLGRKGVLEDTSYER